MLRGGGNSGHGRDIDNIACMIRTDVGCGTQEGQEGGSGKKVTTKSKSHEAALIKQADDLPHDIRSVYIQPVIFSQLPELGTKFLGADLALLHLSRLAGNASVVD